MDTKRLDSLFSSWKKKHLLTRKDALKMDRNWLTYIFGIPVGLIFFAIAYIVTDSIYSSVHFPISIACGVVFLLLFIQMFSDKHFYKDRVELYRLWGLVKHKYYYTDLERIVHSSFYDYNSAAWIKRLSVSFKDYSFNWNTDNTSKTKFDCLTKLFACFRPHFTNLLYYEQMAKLLAYVTTLKKDYTYQNEESQCALKYLEKMSGNTSYDYKKDFLLWTKKYNKQRQNNEYFNLCISIVQNKGVFYDDRLELLSKLFECAYASDGMVDEEELDCLFNIAYYLCIKEWDFLSLKYRFETENQSKYQRKGTENAQQRERCQSVYSNRLREAYKLLSLKTDATMEEVKSAYRTQVKTCHPDTLSPTATATEREEATIRFRTITEAYEFLCGELCAEPVSVAK